MPHHHQTTLETVRATDGAQLSFSLYGGHLCNWRTAQGIERLYLSPLADLQGKGAIRGGMPVIFPQFASDGPLPKHGFARERLWSLVESTVRADGAGTVELALRENAATLAVFPHPFELRLRVVFAGEALHAALTVHNTGRAPFEFTAALHTYLACALASTRVHGLEQCAFIDSAAGGRSAAAQGAALEFSGEVDRRYHAVPGPVELHDALGRVRITQTGFADVVVWNPGAALAKKLADLPDDGFAHFVCIESAAIDKPVQLAAGAQWTGSQRLEASK
jgi:glucose-6-phosphate 1-epimerase